MQVSFASKMIQKKRSATKYAYSPDYAVPPGKTLAETIQAIGIDQTELAQRTGFTEKHVSQIVQGKATISPDAAIRLERVTGVPAHFWNNLEAQYQEQKARLESMEQLQSDLSWLDGIPVKELVDRCVVTASKDRVQTLEGVLRFFGVASVDAWRRGWSKPEFAFRKSKAVSPRGECIAAWLRLGELEAAKTDCQPYDAKKFQANLIEIRALTTQRPENFVPRMVDLCAEAGVALVLVREIKGAPVSGAAKWLTPTKAMICVNLRGKFNDRFWFTFFHEAGHILKDSKQEAFVDVDYQDDPRERSANEFASNLLIPDRWAKELPGLKSQAAVAQFATRIEIHPGIVVGRLQHEGLVPHSHLNALKVRLEWSKT